MSSAITNIFTNKLVDKESLTTLIDGFDAQILPNDKMLIDFGGYFVRTAKDQNEQDWMSFSSSTDDEGCEHRIIACFIRGLKRALARLQTAGGAEDVTARSIMCNFFSGLSTLTFHHKPLKSFVSASKELPDIIAESLQLFAKEYPRPTIEAAICLVNTTSVPSRNVLVNFGSNLKLLKSIGFALKEMVKHDKNIAASGGDSPAVLPISDVQTAIRELCSSLDKLASSSFQACEDDDEKSSLVSAFCAASSSSSASSSLVVDVAEQFVNSYHISSIPIVCSCVLRFFNHIGFNASASCKKQVLCNKTSSLRDALVVVFTRYANCGFENLTVSSGILLEASMATINWVFEADADVQRVFTTPAFCNAIVATLLHAETLFHPKNGLTVSAEAKESAGRMFTELSHAIVQLTAPADDDDDAAAATTNAPSMKQLRAQVFGNDQVIGSLGYIASKLRNGFLDKAISSCKGLVKRLNMPKPTPTSDRKEACIVCLVNKAEYAMIPCGHKVVCPGCEHTCVGSKCPLCSEPVKSSLRVF